MRPIKLARRFFLRLCFGYVSSFRRIPVFAVRCLKCIQGETQLEKTNGKAPDVEFLRSQIMIAIGHLTDDEAG